MSVASEMTELAAFGGQDVSCALLDDAKDSVIIVYDRTSVGQVVFAGLAGVRDCFTGLFACAVDSVISCTTRFQKARPSSQVLPTFAFVSHVSQVCSLALWAL